MINIFYLWKMHVHFLFLNLIGLLLGLLKAPKIGRYRIKMYKNVLELSFTNDIREVPTFKLWQNFSAMIILKNLNF